MKRPYHVDRTTFLVAVKPFDRAGEGWSLHDDAMVEVEPEGLCHGEGGKLEGTPQKTGALEIGFIL